MNVFNTSSASLWFDFQDSNGTQIPDVGTVKYSLYSPSTGVILSNQNLTTDISDTGVQVIIDPAYNLIFGDKLFETRVVIVSWESSGAVHQATQKYRVIQIPVYTTSNDDVRAFLGIDNDELPDKDIDIFSAYLKLRSVSNVSLLSAALTSGTINEVRANEAIMLTTVLDIIPSLRLRVLNSISQGDDRYSRFRDTPDFAALETAARSRLMEVTTGLVTSTVTVPLFVLLTTPVDPITGG